MEAELDMDYPLITEHCSHKCARKCKRGEVDLNHHNGASNDPVYGFADGGKTWRLHKEMFVRRADSSR